MNDEPNPFAAPDADQLRKYTPSRDPSVEHEPHQLDEEFLPHQAAQPDHVGPVLAQDEAVDHNVWDEPGLSPSLSGCTPKSAFTYERWLQAKIHSTSWRTSHLVTALVGILSGIVAATVALFVGLPWTILTTLNILGSITEEVLKLAIASWIVEKRPYLFKSEAQIFVAVAASGLVFAVTSGLAHAIGAQAPLMNGRWTGFALMHIACSTSAALGLIHVWQDGIRNAHKPQLARGAAYFALAAAIHVLYGLL